MTTARKYLHFEHGPATIAGTAKVLCLIGLLVCGSGTGQAAPSIAAELIADGLPRPVGIAHAGDGSQRLFIVLQGGRVLIHDGAQLLATPFLDISARVSCCGERGLLGIAFHPDYASNGLFFVNYTDTDGNTVIARYRVSANANVADASSGATLLTVAQPFANHNGGQLQFGPDGYLYIGLGDGGSGGDPGNRAQNPGLLLGKMLRIDVDSGFPYAVPPDNPLVGVPGARREIWALGLRNPWRFSFDRSTGDLFIGDVGQNSWEEVDFQPASSRGGENYGWRLMEGTHCFNPPTGCNDGSLTLPILEYPHPAGCSVTGGYRYRGGGYPALQGTYLYADFCSGIIWGATPGSDGIWTPEVLLDTPFLISSFGEDESGEIYLAHNAAANGAIYRLKPAVAALRVGSIAVDHNWRRVDLSARVSTPVVIAGPPTYRGSDPGVVRLRRVGDLGFEMRFQEWDYRARDFADNFHVFEDVPYLALQPGRQVMSDGSVWEVGTFDIGGTGTWQRLPFSQPFVAVPHLFLTVQTNNGTQAVAVRGRNVGVNGFEAALFEEQALMDGHAVETLGYLAIHSPAGSGLIDLAGVQVPYLLQSLSADERWSPVLSQRLKVEEERSLDAETGHVDETLQVLALGSQLFAQQVTHNGSDTAAVRRLAPTLDAPMEWGLLRGIDHNWTMLPFAKAYTNPVLVVKPASSRGSDPGVIRLRGLTSDQAQVRYQEWNYLDGTHLPEDVFYLVSEAGEHRLGGLVVEADWLVSNRLARAGQWESVAFTAPLGLDPIVLTAVLSDNGSDAVTTRIRNLGSAGFELAMDEQEANNDGHIDENLGWIAIQSGGGATADGKRLEVFIEPADHNLAPVIYPSATTHRHPTVLADVNSSFGLDPAFPRYARPTGTQIELRLAEEQSLDPETTHALEDLGVFVGE